MTQHLARAICSDRLTEMKALGLRGAICQGKRITRGRGASDGREHVLVATPKSLTLMRAEGERRDKDMALRAS
jgi:hypothetical protein